jgi:hypothetical protein
VLVKQGKLAKENSCPGTAGEAGKVQKLCWYSRESWQRTIFMLLQQRRMVKYKSCPVTAGEVGKTQQLCWYNKGGW